MTGHRGRVRGAAAELLGIVLVAAACACLFLSAAAARAAELAEPRWVIAAHVKSQDRTALRWSPVPGAVSYRLWRRTAAGAPFEVRATVEGIQYFDEPVSPGAEWTYRVQAVGPAGEGPFSEDRSIAVEAVPEPKEAEAVTWRHTFVRLLEQREGPPALEVQLRWNGIRGATAYRILRKIAGEAEYTPIGLVTSSAVIDDTVEEGRTYEYAIVTLGETLDESAPSLSRVVTVSAAKAVERIPAPPPAPALTAVRLWQVLNEIPGSVIHRRVRLDDPYDVAYDAARDLLYVSSTTDRHIIVLKGADGSHVATIGPNLGAAELKHPLGLGLDQAGNLLVADDAQAAVFSISPEGKLRRQIRLAGKGLPRPPRPMDVAAHRDGRLFVTDGANNQVVVFSAAGALLSRWGAPKKGEALLGIGAVEISAEGNVVLADAAAGRIRVFTPAGRPVAAFADRGLGEGKVLYLGGFTVLRDGSILVSDIWNATVTAYGPTAGRLEVAADDSIGAPPGAPLLGPLNMTTDGAGRLFLVEAIANRVLCLNVLPRKKPEQGARP